MLFFNYVQYMLSNIVFATLILYHSNCFSVHVTVVWSVGEKKVNAITNNHERLIYNDKQMLLKLFWKHCGTSACSHVNYIQGCYIVEMHIPYEAIINQTLN